MDVHIEKEQSIIPLQEKQRRRKLRRRKKRLIRAAVLSIVIFMTGTLVYGAINLAGWIYKKENNSDTAQVLERIDNEDGIGAGSRRWRKFYAAELERPELAAELLSINEYSRPGITLPEVKNIFIHYTANAGTDAMQNRSYFESLAQTKERSASAHFVIGYDGSVVQCIPTKEVAYAVMKRNYDSLSIECCYLNENGEFTKETYESLIELTAWLLHKYRLSPEDVLRHYDEGGKNCPKFYVENEEEWNKFVEDLTAYMTQWA